MHFFNKEIIPQTHIRKFEILHFSDNTGSSLAWVQIFKKLILHPQIFRKTDCGTLIFYKNSFNFNLLD